MRKAEIEIIASLPEVDGRSFLTLLVENRIDLVIRGGRNPLGTSLAEMAE